MEYTFDVDNWGGHFSVPYSVVSEHLKICDGNHIKVLLYILAASVRTLTTERIALALGVEEDLVDDAVLFWTDRGVLSIVSKSDKAVDPKPQKSETDAVMPACAAESIKPTDKAVDRKIVVSYSQKEILEKAKKDSELQRLFDEIQRVLKFSLNGKELGKILELYELYHYDVPTILLMAEYCASMDKTSVYYLVAALEDWYNKDITTYEQVEAEIVNRTAQYKYEKTVCKCFGISGKLTASQREYAQKWQAACIDESLLEIAYEKCVEGTGGKIRFKYIDKVLTSWQDKGISTVEQVKADDENFHSKGADASRSTSYSIEQLEELDKNFVSRNEDANK